MSSNLKLKSQVQAIDPMTGVWLPGKITDIRDHEAHVSWKWYKASSWVSLSNVRSPIIKRTLKLNKEDWTATDPSKCQRGDVLLLKKPDGTLGDRIEVMINDPWNCKIVSKSRVFPYEHLHENTTTCYLTSASSTHEETATEDQSDSGDLDLPAENDPGQDNSSFGSTTAAKEKVDGAVQSLSTENSFGQANSSIRRTTTTKEKGDGAVQARSTGNSSGQANSSIRRTTTTKEKGDGAVQARSTGNSSGQANSSIRRTTTTKEKGDGAVQARSTGNSSGQANSSIRRTTTTKEKGDGAVQARSTGNSSGQTSTGNGSKRRIPLGPTTTNNGNVTKAPPPKKTKKTQGKENQPAENKSKTKKVTKEKAVSIALEPAAREIFQQGWSAQEKAVIERASIDELLDADPETLIKFGVNALEAMECEEEPSPGLSPAHDPSPGLPPAHDPSPGLSPALSTERSLWHGPAYPDRPTSPPSFPQTERDNSAPSSPRGPSPPPPFQPLVKPPSCQDPSLPPTFNGQQQTSRPIWQPFRGIEPPPVPQSQDLHSRVANIERMLQSEKKKVEGLEQMLIQERASRLALEKVLHEFIASGKANGTHSTPIPSTPIPSFPRFSSAPIAAVATPRLPRQTQIDMPMEKTEENHFSHLRSIFASVLVADELEGSYHIRPHVISAVLLTGGNEPTVLARSLMRKLFTPFELASCNVRGVKKEAFDPQRVLLIKMSVMQCFQILPVMQESTWLTCIKAMDAANRNSRRYNNTRKLSV